MANYGNNSSEQSILKSIGAVPHKNSGRQTKKGDGTLSVHGQFTVDVKEGKSFTLNANNWSKVVKDAISNGAEPMLLAVLNAGNDISTKLVVIEFDTFMQILEDAS